MATAYHGSSALFDRFDPSHLLEGDGKFKFGVGAYLTSRYTTAAHYSGATSIPDTWGAKLSGDGKEYIGPNLMGRLLMELRDNGKLDYVLPSDAVQPTSNKGKRGRPPKPQTENS